MSKQKLRKLSYIVIGIGTLSCTVFAYMHFQKSAMEKIVTDYWRFALENKMDEAKSMITNDINLEKNRPPGTYAEIGGVRGSDGMDVDFVYRKDIYEMQIKINKITEVKISGYRAGVRVETTAKNGRNPEFIACLGQVSQDKSWKIFYVTISSGDEIPRTIEDKCFEKK